MRSFVVLSFALALTTLLAPEAMCQSGSASVTMSGHVSEAIFISIAPGATASDDRLQVAYSNLNPHTVLVSINTSGSDVRRISIPVQLRSNVRYKISASTNMSGATLRGLCLTSARATGRFVAADAVQALNVAACDASTKVAGARNVNRDGQPFSSPITLMAGPRISLAGTFDSPFNAVEVMMLADVEPHDGQATRSIELILSASPNNAPSPVLAHK